MKNVGLWLLSMAVMFVLGHLLQKYSGAPYDSPAERRALRERHWGPSPKPPRPTGYRQRTGRKRFNLPL